jgi:hypothetical protein
MSIRTTMNRDKAGLQPLNAVAVWPRVCGNDVYNTHCFGYSSIRDSVRKAGVSDAPCGGFLNQRGEA